MNKDFIINNLSRLSSDQIYDAISSGIVTFEELKLTGRFPSTKQVEVNNRLEEDRIWKYTINTNTIGAYQIYLTTYSNGKYVIMSNDRIRDLQRQEQEDIEWRDVISEATPIAFRRYLNLFPTGKYAPQAQNRIAMIEQELDKNREFYLTDLVDNPSEYPADKLRNLINEGKIREQDLINRGIITKEKLKLFLVPPPAWAQAFTESQSGWDQLDPIKENRTDIYFFGIPRSGKTCMLAGLLYYCHKEGLIKLNNDNVKGKKYADLLIRTIKIGYTPPPTVDIGANYIDCSLRSNNDENKKQPANLIDMSGELFVKTYENNIINNNQAIGANEYLRNDNVKIIFFVIDYSADNTPEQEINKAEQSQIFESILALLDKDGTLGKTIGLFTILTKCDLLPNGASNTPAAKAYLDSEYKNLREGIKECQQKYNFNYGDIPFSLGKFMLEKTFEYDPKYSEFVYNTIRETALVNKDSNSKFSLNPKKWLKK